MLNMLIGNLLVKTNLSNTWHVSIVSVFAESQSLVNLMQHLSENLMAGLMNMCVCV